MSPLRVACRASPPSGLPPPPRPYPVVVTYCTERAENPRSQRCRCPLPPQTRANGLTAQASPRVCVSVTCFRPEFESLRLSFPSG